MSALRLVAVALVAAMFLVWATPYPVDATCSTDTDCGCAADCLD